MNITYCSVDEDDNRAWNNGRSSVMTERFFKMTGQKLSRSGGWSVIFFQDKLNNYPMVNVLGIQSFNYTTLISNITSFNRANDLLVNRTLPLPSVQCDRTLDLCNYQHKFTRICKFRLKYSIVSWVKWVSCTCPQMNKMMSYFKTHFTNCLHMT